MKFGERFVANIETMDDKGRGCGPLVGATSKKPGCARGTIPGETIEAAFVGKDKGTLRLGEVVITHPSPDRVKEECPHAGSCGGCALQHVRYEKQVELKLASVNRAIKEAGHTGFSATLIHHALKTFWHRNRMDYVFGPEGELGLKEAGRWDRYIDLATCLMLSKEAVEVMHRVKAWTKKTGLPYWDVRAHKGFFRYLVIREGKHTDERMATLVTHGDVIPTEPKASGGIALQRDPSALVGMTKEHKQALVDTLSPFCTTIYHGINPLTTDLSLASELHLLHGYQHLTEKVSGVTYRVHPNSFFQTNTAMAEILLEHVRRLIIAGPHAKLLDLYCGGGFFALALAKSVDQALGIELDPRNIEMAELNKKDNGILNVSFRAEAAEALSWKDERPDVVILDPPRSGLHPKVRRVLLENLPPRLIYVSCNPRALAEDLKELLRAYMVAGCEAFDLFPQTMHVETVVELRLK